jgi:hypothetical protein
MCRIDGPIISKRILQQIEALRKELAGADRHDQGSFARVFHAFFDATGEPDFMKVSKPVKASKVTDGVEIKDVLELIARRLTGDDNATIQALRLFRIGDAGFLHGGFVAGAFLGTFFYFEQDQQGLVAFNEGGEMTYFSRITLAELPAGAVPVPGPEGVQ